MAIIDNSKCTVHFYKEDQLVHKLDANFYADLWGMLHQWINVQGSFTKAVVNWNGKTIIVEPRLGTPRYE